MDNRKYRLNYLTDITKVKDALGDEYDDYSSKVFRFLSSIPVGSSIDIEKYVKEENIPSFIRLACYHILFDSDLEFNESYTKIRRLPPLKQHPCKTK